MELNTAVEDIVAHAKNGNDIVYDKLTDYSKEQLKDYSKDKVVESLNRFFSDKFIGLKDFRGEQINMATVNFVGEKSQENYSIDFFREDGEWKLVWPMISLEENN